jgi:dTDP-glucose 4,6-dehydratase
MTRILVTGGTGFVGSAVVRMLIQDMDADVLNVDKLTYAANLASLSGVDHNPRYRFARTDVCDRIAMDALFAGFKPDAVMHLAAESHVDRSIASSRDFIETNIVGTFTMLEAARAWWTRLPGKRKDAFRFLHVSTDEVYGSRDDDSLSRETTPYDPSSPYSASKAAADHLTTAWLRTYGLPVLIANCSNNYGPFHFPEKLIPLTILNGMEDRKLPVYGDGTNVRDWLHVEDNARALYAILTRGRIGERYNVGSRNGRSNIEVVRAICTLLDAAFPHKPRHDALIEFVQDRPGHDRRYAMDIAKLESELGWQPKHDFDSGLAQTVRWFIDNDWWWRPLRERVYGGERLGLV